MGAKAMVKNPKRPYEYQNSMPKICVEDVNWLRFGILPGMQVKVQHIREQAAPTPQRINEMTKNCLVYPRIYEGVIEDLYPRFAVVRVKHYKTRELLYRTTVHIFDLVCGKAKVEVLW